MKTSPLAPTRREMMQLAAAGVTGACYSNWLNLLAARAGEQAARGVKHKSCILLWMDGGPAHLDTFDLKPDAPDTVRGEFKPIQTAVPGMQFSERFPRLAPLAGDLALLRGMSTGEAEHGRACNYMHSGYKPGAGGLRYPGLGSILSASRGESASGMPNFVITGSHINPANWSFVSSPGYLGPRHQPLIIHDLDKGVQNLKPTAETANFDDRLDVLGQLTAGFLREYQPEAGVAQKAVYDRAVQLMRSDKSRAFDLALEPAESAAAYGKTPFGRGCLLARRLVEVGVPFVEVYLATPGLTGGWDTHTLDRYKQFPYLCDQVNEGMSALLIDLKQRGLLDSTLVIWMGEFGRTPNVKKDGGRDHYAKAWTTVLAGGGVKGGQVIGRTDKTGANVEERPVSAIDFMATVCTLLGIDPEDKFNAPGDRPVRIVERGAQVVKEVFA
ncbi:MAG: DUF1501 domain-containing protein [Planctomycetia bacterium]|nr:DUF1501 domain-containing protein [Planctomycetia bacterium]